MTSKTWHKLPAPPAGFSQAVGLPPFQAHLLYNRGIRHRSEIEPYLSADSRLRNDPMLLPDMGSAVSRLTKAIDANELIGVFGDFDTDGITGTALLVRGLGDVGARVLPYLPDRLDEGHGLNDDAVRALTGRGVTLLVTVDCGASSIDEIALAASLGADTIVTDHHNLTDNPPASFALINPKRSDSAYPYRELTGVGMAFKLVEALYAEIGEPWPAHLLELVALGTVADVGPLTGENRSLVKEGIERLKTTQNPGLRALADVSKVKLASLATDDLSFRLIPRLNAPGRVGSARTSLDLLTTTSEEEAALLASQMELMNRERRALTEEAMQEAERQVAQVSADEGVPPLAFVESEAWTPGILGLIAARLTDLYHRPAVAVARGSATSRASARSIPGLDLYAVLAASAGMFDRFGGHSQAAGFTVPTASLPALRRQLVATASEKLDGVDLIEELDVECEVPLSLPCQVEFDFVQTLSPFGAENPAPVFLTRGARVIDARTVGRDRQHLKMRLGDDGGSWDAIAFRQGDMLAAARDRIDVVYTVALDNWGERPKVQLTVLDMRASR